MTATTEETTTTGYALTDTVVPTPAFTILTGSRDIYVTEVLDGGTASQQQAAVGTVMSAQGSALGGLAERTSPVATGGWITNDPDKGTMRVNGALVNPTPENGKYYRSLAPTLGQPHGLLYQYHDNDHVADRHLPLAEYNIVAGPAGTTWPIPNDGTSAIAEPYIEVQAPAGEVADDQHSGDEPAVDASVVFGKAKLTDGALVLNPATSPGMELLVWFKESASAESHHAIYHGTVLPEPVNDEAVVAVAGYWYGTNDNHHYSGGDSSTFTLDERMNWAEIALAEPERVGTEEAKSALRRTLATLQAEFEEFNEALNEKADEKEWCSDYEEIISRLDGMEGREERRKDWDVEVSVEFTLTDSNPSGRVDSEVCDLYGDMSTSEIRIEGSATITVSVSGCRRDDVNDEVTEDMIVSELEGRGSQSFDIEVGDWSIETVSEA